MAPPAGRSPVIICAPGSDPARQLLDILWNFRFFRELTTQKSAGAISLPEKVCVLCATSNAKDHLLFVESPAMLGAGWQFFTLENSHGRQITEI